MRYLKPSYYDKFVCVADLCPATCCEGWQIMIDEESLDRYENVTGQFGKRLEKSIDWDEGCFHQCNGRCAFLNDKNLCDIVTELGGEALSETCTRYPRHIEEYEGEREYSLSISCPIAAKMVLECRNGLDLVETEDETEDPLEDEFEDFDILLYTKLQDARALFIDLIREKKEIPITVRMQTCLHVAKSMQECLEENRLFDMDQLLTKENVELILEKVLKDNGTEKPLFICEEQYYKIKEDFLIFYKLERMREDWFDTVEATWDYLYKDGYGNYKKRYEAFLKKYGSNGESEKEWQLFLENLFLFFIYTYFCGAVYDDWIYTKVALSVFSVIYISEFIMVKSLLADNNIDKEQWITMAYRYAREVEHSDDNLNMLEEYLLRWMQEEER